MIDYHQFCQIKDLHEREGLKAAQIAGVLGLDPRTVAYWLGQDRFRPRKVSSRPSQLDPFTPQIRQMLEKYPYSAMQVWQRLREQGFAGSYSTVKAYVRTVRPRRQPAFLKLAFAPGECAQVDWGSCGSVRVGQTTRRLSFFVLVLCYSRLMYVEFTVSQTMEHFLACHQHAFEVIGGVPHIHVVMAVEGPVRMPFPGHDVLDGQASARDTFLAQTRFSIPPAPPVILDRLKHHPQTSSVETPVGQQPGEFIPQFGVIRPVPAAAGLTREPRLDRVAGLRPTRGIAQQRDEFGDHLVVILRRRTNKHPAHHPALDGL